MGTKILLLNQLAKGLVQIMAALIFTAGVYCVIKGWHLEALSFGVLAIAARQMED